MKKYYFLIIVALIFGLVLTGCSLLSNVGQVPATGQSGISYLTKHTEDDPKVIDLLAGQTINVGDVLVWNDGDYLYVKYVITDPDWCLTETHLQVATSLEGIPQTKKGNPIPGKFDNKGEHACLEEFLYTIPLADLGTSLFIAAHAVVSSKPIGESETILYGSQRDTGVDNGLYRIDLEAGTATRLFDTGETDTNSPNGLGYDPVNRRLYYMKYDIGGPSVLYFYDIVGGMEYAAGLSLGQVVVGASFYDGAYYYIPDNTADLYKVNLHADGHVSNYELVWGNFNGGNVAVYHFGDFAIDEYGMLYASTGSTAEFFELNVVTGEYKLITNSPGAALGVQVSFGSDGTLYGHAAGTGEFFEINLTNGTMLSIGYVASDERDRELFSDLASGEFFVPIIETAWGDGDRFVKQGNWATYFTYKVQEAVNLELTPTNYGPGLSETGTGEAVLYNPVGDPNFIVKVNIENAKEKNASYKVWIIADQPLLPLGHGGISTTWYYLGELFTDNNGDGSFYREITLGLSGLLGNIQIALNPGPLAGYKSEIGEIVIH